MDNKKIPKKKSDNIKPQPKTSSKHFHLGAEGQYEADGILYSEKEAWQKLEGFVSKSKLEYIKSIEDIDIKENLFKSLFSLQKRIAEGQTKRDKIPSRIDKAIERARNKSLKEKRERLNLIVTTDSIFSIGQLGEYTHKRPSDLNNFKHLTKDNIIIIGYETYKIIKPIYLSQASEVRVITHKTNEISRFDDNIKIVFYNDPLKAIAHKRDDYREIFVAGGQSMFELYFTRMTDLYLATEDTIYENSTAWFPNFKPWDFDVRESAYLPPRENSKETSGITISHLRLIKGHKLRLTPNKYSNGLLMEEKFRYLLQ